MEPLPQALAEGLARPEAYPGDPEAAEGVRWVQTHISHVFLTRRRVYKLRKAVTLAFLDFGSRAARNEDCLREVRLNRRLAPDVYLGVAPVRPSDGGVVVGALGEALAASAGPEDAAPEHVVVMRRLAEGGDALSRLERGALGPEHLETLARVLAPFHASTCLGRPAPFEPSAWQARVAKPMRDNLETLGSVRDRRKAGGRAAGRRRAESQVERADVAALREALEAALAAQGADLERRRRDGRVVDGHGDLHLQHVWFERSGGPPLVIDCIEFDEDLRRIDTASEVAFLAMDLDYRGRSDLAAIFLASYANESDDFDLFSVVDLYASYRAAVRAKVAALAADDPGIVAAQREAAAGSAARHLALAARCLAPRAPGGLVVLCGTVGSGKSSVAREVAAAAEGVVVSSDRTRKRLAGLDPSARAGAAPEGGIYTRDMTERVYAALLERAAPVIASGRTALLDATFAKTRHRHAVLAWARERGVAAACLEVVCPEAVALERLERRAREGRDPSDAGPELLARSRAAYEPPREWPAERRLRLDTSVPGWHATAREIGARLRPQG